MLLIIQIYEPGYSNTDTNKLVEQNSNLCRWELINPDAKMVYLPHPKPEDGVMISFSKL